MRERDRGKVGVDVTGHDRRLDAFEALDISAPDCGQSIFADAPSSAARAPAPSTARGLYVDVTRAREDVTIAYGKNEVQDFGDLLVRAQRDNGKVLVRDVVRDVNLRIEREEVRKRLRNAAFEQGQKPKIDRVQEPKIDCGRGALKKPGDSIRFIR